MTKNKLLNYNILVDFNAKVVSLLIMNSQITENYTAHIFHSHYAQITFESKHQGFLCEESATDSL